MQRVYLSLCLWFCPSVRAKRGIWSKRVLIRKIVFFSFSVGWRNTMTLINFYFHRKFLIFLRNDRDCKAVGAPDIFEKLSWLYGCCVDRIPQLFTNFYLHRKVLIFLRIYRDCEDVDHLYNTRKRYAVIECLDLTRNISWLSSCFSKIKKPNKHCSGNHSMIAVVSIIDTIYYIYP